MERSLFSAQVQFVDDHLALIHIPLELYPFFLQPILQLLLHDVPPIRNPSGDQSSTTGLTSPAFLNVSITPVECSVVCSRSLADRYFLPLLDNRHEAARTGHSRVNISSEDFIAMQVEGQGLDAGQRVLELTTPLAMAGISIFFISTYYSDYILIPQQSKDQVIRALKRRGFNFETSSDAFVNSAQEQHQTPPASTHPSPPDTPPPSSLPELQMRTFASLRKHNVHPHVDGTLQLVHCAAHYREPSEPESYSVLRPGLITALLIDQPRFLSLTVTATDPSASILLEKRLLPRFSTGSQSDPYSLSSEDSESRILLGSKDDILIPIILDLRDLPFSEIGIVCGVAGRMAAASPAFNGPGDSQKDEIEASGINGLSLPSHNLNPAQDESLCEAVEISFLSTARAGTVIVSDKELDKAMASLEKGKNNSDSTSEAFFEMSLE